MRPKDRDLAQELETGLISFDRKIRPLPGIRDSANREVFLEQILESIHRVQYVSVIRNRQLSTSRTDPSSSLFDPLKAAILHQNQGDVDEAFWMVFLFVHFGKHVRAGWRYAREVYGRLGEAGRWDWESTSSNPSGFRDWLRAHQDDLEHEGVGRGFGNHRKFQSLDARSANGTGAAFESYINWVGPPRTHRELMEDAYEQVGGDPYNAFDNLYHSMSAVASFGRLAKFDYLTMVGKLNLAPIKPGSTYLPNTGAPTNGARLLFAGDRLVTLSPILLDEWLKELDATLDVGMQVLEDALCNWQKSPAHFIPFRG